MGLLTADETTRGQYMQCFFQYESQDVIKIQLIYPEIFLKRPIKWSFLYDCNVNQITQKITHQQSVILISINKEFMIGCGGRI